MSSRSYERRNISIIQALALLWVTCVVVQGAALGNPFDPRDKAEAAAIARTYAAMSAAETKALWGQFKAQYRKSYKDENEDNLRFGHFKTNTQQIISINSDPANDLWYAAHNEFSDLSFDEFKATRAMPEYNVGPATQGRKMMANDLKTVNSRDLKQTYTYPKAWDWRAPNGDPNKKKVLAIRNQGNCGSCWAFAATAVVETWALMNGKLNATQTNQLSDQQVLDCTYSATYNGCNGGYPYDALNYVKANFETLTTTYGSYTSGSSGKSGACKSTVLSSAPVKVQTNAYTKLPVGSTDNLLQAIYTYGAIDMGFNIVSSFQVYKSGIYYDPKCANGCSKVNHNMAAVGYNVTAGLGNANSFILVKNSWGTSWGESGYIRIRAMPNGDCGTCNSLADNYYVT